jgi:hypothetical protein
MARRSRREQHRSTQEATMTLDDVYGSELDRFPLEQEQPAWEPEDLGLDWDETEVLEIATELCGRRGAAEFAS